MRRFNDRKAKRLGKAEFSTSIVTEELYKQWRKDNPDISLSNAEFNKVWESITDKIQSEITTNPQGVKLAFHCGELIMQYLPKKFKAIDPYTSNLIGEKAPFLNITSKGKVGKISWIRKGAVRFNPQIMLYAFDHTRKIAHKAISTFTEKPEIFRNSNMIIHDKQGDDI